MRTFETRTFDTALWLVCLACLLALVTGCSAAIPAPVTVSQSQDATAIPTATAGTSVQGLAQNPTPSPTPMTCTVQTGIPAGYLNLRTGPGVDRAVLRVLAEGETLLILSRGPWLQVTDREGVRGYVNARYCK